MPPLLPDGEKWYCGPEPANVSWQVLEVRLDGVADPLDQYVWDVRYVDAPVVRFHDGNTDGDLDGGSEEGDNTLYYTTDANWNVTALVDAETGEVVERYMYDPYGKATVCEEDWTPREDNASAVANDVLYCGYRLDAETGLYHVRYRYYHPTLGRWLGRDVAGYVDGFSLYEYVRARPTLAGDPAGLSLLMEFNRPTPLPPWPDVLVLDVLPDFDNDQPDRNLRGDYADPRTRAGKAGADFATFDYCCMCVTEAAAGAEWDKKMADEYSMARSDPSNTSATDIERAKTTSLARQGIRTTVGGATTDTGDITVVPKRGPCAELLDAHTEVHELVHKKDEDLRRARIGDPKSPDPRVRQAYRMDRQSGRKWASDEMKAYRTGQLYMQSFLDACNEQYDIVP